MSSPETISSGPPRLQGRPFARLLVACFAWRFVCFWLVPISWNGWHGTACEASALASSGLVAIWLAVGDGAWWQRLLVSCGLLIGLHVAQDAGLFANGEWSLTRESAARIIFWFAEGEAMLVSFVAAFSLRMLTGWRIIRHTGNSEPPELTVQIPLRNLFLLTALVSILVAVARTNWVRSMFEHDSYAAHHQIVMHALAIGLALFPAGVLLLPRFGGFAIALMIASWLAFPFLLDQCAQQIGWIQFEILRAISTTVAGTAVAALITAIEMRWLGYRWQTWIPPINC